MYPVLIMTAPSPHAAEMVVSGLEAGDLEDLDHQGFKCQKSTGEHVTYSVRPAKFLTLFVKKGYEIASVATVADGLCWTLVNQELSKRRGSCSKNNTLVVNEDYL